MATQDKNLGLIILDNGGGITLQMGDFGHYYQDAEMAAQNISDWLHNPDTSDWEGRETEAVELDPTDEQVANGGYRMFQLDRDVDTLLRLARELSVCDWCNARDLSEALCAKREKLRNCTNSDNYKFLG